jgi:hypothetical protein
MLRISDEYLIDADDVGVTLVRETVITGEGRGASRTKAENIGKSRQQPVGYYATVEQALQAYVRKATAEAVAVESATVEQLLAAINKAVQDVAECAKSLPKRSLP